MPMPRYANVQALIDGATQRNYKLHEGKPNERTVYAGSWPMDPLHLYDCLPEGYREIEEWGDGFRLVFASYLERSTVTYCEGDLLVTKHDTHEGYVEEMVDCAQYYGGIRLRNLSKILEDRSEG